MKKTTRLFLLLSIIQFSSLYNSEKFIFTTAAPTYDTIINEANNDAEYITNVRRSLHKVPERMYNEFKSSKIIKEFLKDNNISFTEGWAINPYAPPAGGTGVVAEIGTGHPPCVSLRADFDALPIQELTESSFKSEHPGFMHACGHDSHAAMLLGASKILKKYEKELEGTVRLIFQPAEEGGKGAEVMIDEGVLSKYPPVMRSFGFHIDPKNPTGTVISRPGTIWAAVSGFVIQFVGSGGHAARPHQTIDPIVAGMAFIRAVFDICARELYFQHSMAGVISITTVKTSTLAPNVIPDSITIGGSVRALELSTIKMMMKRIDEVAHKVASSYQCKIVPITDKPSMLKDEPGPPVHNDPQLYKFYEKIVSEGARGNKILYTEPEMVSEDYSYISELVPSVFSFLGIGSGGEELENHPPTNYNLHNANFFLDERILPIGAALHTHIAFQNLIDLNQKTSTASHTSGIDEL